MITIWPVTVLTQLIVAVTRVIRVRSIRYFLKAADCRFIGPTAFSAVELLDKKIYVRNVPFFSKKHFVYLFG